MYLIDFLQLSRYFGREKQGEKEGREGERKDSVEIIVGAGRRERERCETVKI